jgi:hypothetical protein
VLHLGTQMGVLPALTVSALIANCTKNNLDLSEVTGRLFSSPPLYLHYLRYLIL